MSKPDTLPGRSLPDLPRLESAGPGATHIYLVDLEGTRWRVHDCVLVVGKGTLRRSRANERATHRVFVTTEGVRRSYRFTRGESHQLTASRLAVQLRQAGYLPTEQYDPNTRSAR